MTKQQIAICDDVAIYGVGDDIQAALADAVENGLCDGAMPAIVPMSTHSSYDGGVVDLTSMGRLGADGEAVSGARAKARRITPELVNSVRANGGSVAFDVRRDGVLVIAA